MTEYTEIFDIVLYFKRKVFVKPTEPVYADIQKSNPKLNLDGILDIYSDLNNKYKKDLSKYEKIENKNMIISACVLITEDVHFIRNYMSIEKETFFIEWSKESKKMIDETVVKLLNK